MIDAVKKILNHLSKNTLIALIIGLATYIINDKMKVTSEQSEFNQIRLLNDQFEFKQELQALKQDIDSLKKWK